MIHGQVIFYGASVALFVIGLYAVLIKRNLIKIMLGLSLIEGAVNLFLINIGYIWGKTAPILSNKELLAHPSAKAVDPVPQALVLTAIVIGVAVLALALSVIMRIYETHGTLNVDKIKELRW